MKKNNYQVYTRGFTLVEMIVVIAVMGVIGAIVLVIITSVLRGASRATNTSAIKHNGNFAISQIAKEIRYAKSFDGLSVDDTTYTASCSATATPTYHYIKVTNFTNVQTRFALLCAPPTKKMTTQIGASENTLIDTTAVTLKDNVCGFTCVQKNQADLQSINIFFTLQATASGQLFNDVATVPFNTSVVYRNTAQ